MGKRKIDENESRFGIVGNIFGDKVYRDGANVKFMDLKDERVEVYGLGKKGRYISMWVNPKKIYNVRPVHITSEGFVRLMLPRGTKKHIQGIIDRCIKNDFFAISEEDRMNLRPIRYWELSDERKQRIDFKLGLLDG